MRSTFGRAVCASTSARVPSLHVLLTSHLCCLSLPPPPTGEYWDSLAYQFDGTPAHNQDAHRQRIVNWIEAAGGLATAFGERGRACYGVPAPPPGATGVSPLCSRRSARLVTALLAWRCFCLLVDFRTCLARPPCILADITTKGILHAVFERCEYWRLSDAAGKPPGLMGWWPSRAVTFLENHDTGSTQVGLGVQCAVCCGLQRNQADR